MVEEVVNEELRNADDYCYSCNMKCNYNYLLVCDHCNTKACHMFCL